MKNKFKYAIGISSFNEAGSIAFVIKQIDEGIKKYFKPEKTIIINLDSNSTDGTKKVFLSTATESPKLYMDTPMGKGRAMLKFFAFCKKNKIPYLATIDADLKSIQPEWVRELLSPIINNFDFVIPVYRRNRFEANITNHFAYPLILANYGIELRQPLGGEFGYSLSLCEYLLKQPKHLKTFQYGIDIFITINALVGGFNIAECYLSKKIHSPSFYHMESTFRQVLESGLYVTKINMNTVLHFGKLKKNKNSSGIDEVKYFPHKSHISKLLKQLRKRFRKYYQEGLYSKIIKDKNLINKLKDIIDNNNLTSLNEAIWTDYLIMIMRYYYSSRNIYDTKVISRVSIPIYRWRVITYWLQVENLSAEDSEKVLRKQALLLKKKAVIL